MIDEIDIVGLTQEERHKLYEKYYKIELEKYTYRKVSKYCKFPLSESYSEDAWHNLLVWTKFSLHRLSATSYEVGFTRIARYYAVFDYALDAEDGYKLLSELDGDYEFSKENDLRMDNWIFFHNLKNCRAVPARKSYESGSYSDDEEGIMSALSHGEGDLFGL